MKVIAQNRKARHDYEILETFEAGLELRGGEVKSIRAGNLSLNEAFVSLRKGEAYLTNMYVKPYEAAETPPTEASRSRKLLLHKQELSKLVGAVQAKAQTVVPTKLYFKKGYAKVEIALGKGKKIHDKRQTLKRREQEREADRAIRGRN